MADWVILISFSAVSADSINRYGARFTVTIEGISVEDFVMSTSITVWLVAVADLYSGFAVEAD